VIGSVPEQLPEPTLSSWPPEAHPRSLAGRRCSAAALRPARFRATSWRPSLRVGRRDDHGERAGEIYQPQGVGGARHSGDVFTAAALRFAFLPLIGERHRGMPLHVPLLAVRIWPPSAAPDILASTLLVGARGATAQARPPPHRKALRWVRWAANRSKPPEPYGA
jgi:hypothetical protein